MISRWTALRRAVRAMRERRYGDVAAYKGLLFGGRAYPDVARRLAELDDPLPAIDLAALDRCPPGSFGLVYAEHMRSCGLQPLTFSQEARADIAGGAVMPLRYALLHDAFHVLLDEDTSWPGECAVWSFVAAQKYGPAFDRNGKLALVAYSIMNPSQRKTIRAAYDRGRIRGERAPCLLCRPITDYWERPLDQVRQELGLG